MKHRDMVIEALGLRRGNNRWRAIWRVANKEHRAKYSVLFAAELNKRLKRIYSADDVAVLAGPTHSLFANIQLEVRA